MEAFFIYILAENRSKLVSKDRPRVWLLPHKVWAHHYFSRPISGTGAFPGFSDFPSVFNVLEQNWIFYGCFEGLDPSKKIRSKILHNRACLTAPSLFSEPQWWTKVFYYIHPAELIGARGQKSRFPNKCRFVGFLCSNKHVFGKCCFPQGCPGPCGHFLL